MNKLSDFGAVRVNDSIIKDKHGENDRIRYIFDVPERQSSIDCFRFFSSHNKELAKERNAAAQAESAEGETASEAPAKYDFPIKEQMKIYL